MRTNALVFVPVFALLVASGCKKDNESAGPSEASSKTAAATLKAPNAPTVLEGTVAIKAPTAALAEKESSCGSMKTTASNTDGAESQCKKSGGCNQWDSAAADVLKRETATDATWQAYRVSGMKCGGCERRVIANLGKIEGVVGVEADAELGQVRIATSAKDANHKKAQEAAKQALANLYPIAGNN